MRLPSDPAAFLATLNARGVRALIIGATAVAFHAKPRYTQHVDVLVEDTAETAALVRAPREFGAGGIVTASIPGVTFEEAWPNRVAGTFQDVPVFYISRDDLIRAKEASARPIDRFDVCMLRSMR